MASREVEQHHKLFTADFTTLVLEENFSQNYFRIRILDIFCKFSHCPPTWRGSIPPPPPSARTSASPPAPTCGRAGRCSLKSKETLFSTTLQ